MPLAPGTLVAGYRIEAVLGSGGMGTVYRARHPTLPRNDALKILSAELSLDQQFQARFIREADLAATLNHPNIVTVFNRGETEDGQLWIAMEYVEGTAANDIAQPNLTPSRIVRIVTDVSRALDYAHSRRVLHRDVKPGNFLLSNLGVPEQERVLLADFGIARALDDASSLTATGSMVFTAAYAAPEAIEGGQVDHRTDIYSLGCSLYRLLVGRTPYDGASLPAMLMAHMMKPVPRPSEEVQGLPRAIDDVIALSLAKNPADRFQSAGALAAATAEALTGPASGGGSDTRAWSTPPAFQTGPVGVRPPPEPTLHTMGSVPSGQFAPPSSPPAVHATQQPKRRRRALIAGAVALVVVTVATVAGVFFLGADKPAGPAPYQPQTLNGVRGTVQLGHQPLAVAAIGPGDPDAVLSLGVQPVAIGGLPGKLPSWLAPLSHSQVPLVANGDPAAVAARKPDLIIDTGDIDQPTYDRLAAIAPTLTRPADAAQDWTWQTQLTWIATALGRTEAAKKLLEDALSQKNSVKARHPVFGGKSMTVVTYTGTATTVAAKVSEPTSYLEGLGFAYNPRYRRGANDPPETVVTPDSAFFRTQPTDVMLVCRTDPEAGGGGYNGLPTGFSAYVGALVIVDEPALIAALDTGGPAANAYLNEALVNKLASQIH